MLSSKTGSAATSNYQNCPFFIWLSFLLIWVKLGNPTVWLLNMPLYMQTSLPIPPVLSSPLLPHMTHSHFIISISKVFANFLIDLFLDRSSPSKERTESGGGIISTVFPGSSHTNSNCSQTYRSTGHCTFIFVVANSKHCAES